MFYSGRFGGSGSWETRFACNTDDKTEIVSEALLPLITGASIPMGQGGHVPPIFMKGGRPW